MNEYTVKELAAMTKTNPETIRRWIRSGKLKAKKDPKSGENLISENDFNDFIEMNPKYSYCSLSDSYSKSSRVSKTLGGPALVLATLLSNTNALQKSTAFPSGVAGLGGAIVSGALLSTLLMLKKRQKNDDDAEISSEALNDIAVRLVEETENKIVIKETEISELQLKLKKAQLELETYKQELTDLQSYIEELD